MALNYERIGTNPDGTPHWLITSDDPSKTVLLTGAISGPVAVGDEVIDVSPVAIEVESPEKALAISDAIGLQHVLHGHPDCVKDEEADSFGFAHTASDGTVYASARASEAAIEEITKQLGVPADEIVRLES